MKLLTLNFLTCARKQCKASAAAFPLHPRDAELERVESEVNATFLVNMLPRLEWAALRGLVQELGLSALPDEPPSSEDLTTATSDGNDGATIPQTLRDLHELLIETGIASGRLVCGNCGHEYAVKEGIANFLLPSHMV